MRSAPSHLNSISVNFAWSLAERALKKSRPRKLKRTETPVVARVRARTPPRRHRASGDSFQYGVARAERRAKMTGKSALGPSCFSIDVGLVGLLPAADEEDDDESAVEGTESLFSVFTVFPLLLGSSARTLTSLDGDGMQKELERWRWIAFVPQGAVCGLDGRR